MSFTKINHYEKEYADTHHDTALNVTEGVEDQPIVSPYFTRRKKRRLSTDEYVEGILAGNITTLSQAITLVESNNPAHYAQAQQIIERCLPHAGKSVRIGITGVPGAGKSTFIERPSATWSPRCGTNWRCWPSTPRRNAAGVQSSATKPAW